MCQVLGIFVTEGFQFLEKLLPLPSAADYRARRLDNRRSFLFFAPLQKLKRSQLKSGENVRVINFVLSIVT